MNDDQKVCLQPYTHTNVRRMRLSFKNKISFECVRSHVRQSPERDESMTFDIIWLSPTKKTRVIVNSAERISSMD